MDAEKAVKLNNRSIQTVDMPSFVAQSSGPHGSAGSTD